MQLRLNNDVGWIEGFWANWVEQAKFDAFNSTETDEASWGIYGHLDSKKTSLPFNTEAYILGKDNDTGMRDDHRITVGGRLFGDIGETNLHFDVEGGYQFNYDGTEVRAYFIAAEATYTFKDLETKPWITAGFDFATGDDNPNDGVIKTFEPNSPFGHYYFGYIDHVGRQNVISPWLRVGAKPTKKLTTTVSGHWFWADEPADSLYSPCNCTQIRRRGNANAQDYIGFELDFVGKYSFNHHLSLLAGYSYFWADEFINTTNGGREDVQRLYTQLQFTF